MPSVQLPPLPRRWVHSACALLLTGLISGCASVKPPSMQVAGLKFANAGLTGAGLDVSFDVRNPNPEPLAIERFEYELKLNGRRLGRGYYPDSMDLGGFAESKIESQFDLNWLSLPGSIKSILERDRVQAEVRGIFYVRKDNGGFRELKFKNKASIRLQK